MAGAFAATVEKPTSASVEAARHEAMSLSTAFRATSEEVLPSVVTLERRPTMEKVDTKKGPVQPGIPDEMLQGPFGELFRSPQMKSSLISKALERIAANAGSARESSSTRAV